MFKALFVPVAAFSTRSRCFLLFEYRWAGHLTPAACLGSSYKGIKARALSYRGLPTLARGIGLILLAKVGRGTWATPRLRRWFADSTSATFVYLTFPRAGLAVWCLYHSCISRHLFKQALSTKPPCPHLPSYPYSIPPNESVLLWH